MNKLFVLTLLLISPFSFSGVEDVVKVSSYYCGSSEKFKGSGVAFNYEGNSYVITSEHVVLQDNTDICHEIILDSGKVEKSILMSADWGVGLALLKVSETVDHLKSFDELFDVSGILKSKQVSTIGYPYYSESPLMDSRGLIVNPKSGRHFIPLLDELIEIEGAHVEYGMSGGAVFNEKNEKVLGILSHQVLELSPGRPSDVRILNTTSELTFKNHPFAITSADVKKWFFSVMNGQIPQMKRTTEGQLFSRSEIIRDGVLFILKSNAKSAQDDGSTVGGASTGDGIGIGGASSGDGFGIGGSAISLKKNSIVFKLLDPNAKSKDDWINKIIDALLKRKNIVIASVKIGNEIRSISSLESFFSLIHRGAEPVIQSVDTDGNAVQSRSDVNEVGIRLSQYLNKLSEVENKDLLVFKERLLLLSKLACSTNYWLIDLDELKNMIDTSNGAFSKQWQSLIVGDYYDESTAALIALNELYGLLN